MRKHPAHSHWPDRTDLPARRADSRARELDQPHSTAPRSSLDRLDNRDPEIVANDSYRLVASASGSDRSSGSLLDEAAATLDYSPEINYDDPECLKEVARQYRERTARAFALEDAALELAEAVRRAAMVRRRIERRQETQRRRAERGTTRNPRRPCRPVKVDVDPAAWEAVKRNAVRRRRTVGDAVGELVLLAVQDGVVPRNRPKPPSTSATRQRSGQSSGQTSGRLFARLFVDEETWAQFRVLAFDAHIPIARFVGLLVEREAHNLQNRENR